MAQFIVVLDASIVNVALPSIGRGLHFSEQNLPWVVNAYLIAFGGFLLLGGRAADLLGRRRVFMAGLALVAVASLAAGFASTQGQLIAARAAQGLGAAIVSPAALSIVTTLFSDGAERNKALGAWGAVAGSAGAVGVLLGGILTEGLGWEWVLWVNVPVSLIALALTPGLIPESRSEADAPPLRRRRRRDDHGRPVAARLRAARRHQRRLGLDQDRQPARGLGRADRLPSWRSSCARRRRWSRSGSSAPGPSWAPTWSGLLLGASLFSMFFFVTLYMQQVLHYSPIHAGLSYLPLSAAIIVSAGLGGQLVTRFGFKPILAIGMLSVAVGLLWFSGISVGGSFLDDILGPSLLAAIGLGFGFVTSTIAAVAGVRAREQGLASGLINTSQQFGGAIGLAVLSAIATSRTHDVLAAAARAPSTPSPRASRPRSWSARGSPPLGVLATLLLIRTRDSRAHVEMAASRGRRRGSLGRASPA